VCYGSALHGRSVFVLAETGRCLSRTPSPGTSRRRPLPWFELCVCSPVLGTEFAYRRTRQVADMVGGDRN